MSEQRYRGLVIFDVDGVMVDREYAALDVYKGAWEEALRRLKIQPEQYSFDEAMGDFEIKRRLLEFGPEVALGDLFKYFKSRGKGGPLDDFFNREYMSTTHRAYKVMKEVFVDEGWQKLKLKREQGISSRVYSGVLEQLHELQEQGYLLAAYTSRSRLPNEVFQSGEEEVEAFFEPSLVFTTYKERRPFPKSGADICAIIEKAREAAQVDEDGEFPVVYVGDNPKNDLPAAAQAKIPIVVPLWGEFYSADEVRREADELSYPCTIVRHPSRLNAAIRKTQGENVSEEFLLGEPISQQSVKEVRERRGLRGIGNAVKSRLERVLKGGHRE